jgi:hypothetical protein
MRRSQQRDRALTVIAEKAATSMSERLKEAYDLLAVSPRNSDVEGLFSDPGGSGTP